MDIVYVLRPGPKDCIELRYSLRSLKNVSYDNVFVVGYKPKWLTGAKHIPCSDLGSKQKNVRDKLNLIINNKEISEDFIYMHDDNYILKPIKNIGYYKRGTLKEHSKDTLDSCGKTRYYLAVSGVINTFPDGDSFDVHTPIVFSKKKLKVIMDKYGDSIASKRSLYCNFWGIKGEEMPSGNKDCKVFGNKSFRIKDKQIFLSSDDSIVNGNSFLNTINNAFPRASRYEGDMKNTIKVGSIEINRTKI